MECGGDIGGGVREFVKILGELCNVLGAAIADDLLGHSKAFPYMISEVLCHLWCGEGISDGDEDDHFGESVDNYQYSIVAV